MRTQHARRVGEATHGVDVAGISKQLVSRQWQRTYSPKAHRHCCCGIHFNAEHGEAGQPRVVTVARETTGEAAASPAQATLVLTCRPTCYRCKTPEHAQPALYPLPAEHLWK